jgi:hypothetical protein
VNFTRAQLMLLGGTILTSGIASWTLKHRAAIELQKTSAALQEQAEQLAELTEESARLSNAIVHARSSQPLPEDQFHELLRLRGRMGRLLEQKAELNQLAATNQLLHTALANSENAPTAQARWSREELNYAGYADPESAAVSTLWAWNSKDPAVQMAMLTPEGKASLEHLAAEGKAVSVEAYCKQMAEMLNPAAATGVSLVGKKQNSPEEVLLDLYYDGEGKTRRFLMKRIDGAWKLQDLVSITAN